MQAQVIVDRLITLLEIIVAPFLGISMHILSTPDQERTSKPTNHACIQSNTTLLPFSNFDLDERLLYAKE